jgi:hypothetical protein
MVSPPLLLLASAALLLLLRPIATATAVAAGENNNRYCGSDTPLDTPYFAPFQQTVVEAVGCEALPPPPSPNHVFHVVNVIRLEDPPPEVSLHIIGKDGIHVVLKG